MTSTAGMRLILRLNWPWYAAGLATLLAAALAALALGPASPWFAAGLAAAVLAAAWLAGSLLVSHLVYDRSPLARGAWLEGHDGAAVRRVAILHAGQDEASASVARRLPAAACTVLDFHDAERTSSASLRRARARSSPRDAAAAGRAAPDDGPQDLVLLVFAAHELRRDEDRAALLARAARALAPGGRVLVVEHLRDAWNLLAYGPGAFHFLPRAAWLRSFDAAGLVLRRETTCTPFVHVFSLEARA